MLIYNYFVSKGIATFSIIYLHNEYELKKNNNNQILCLLFLRCNPHKIHELACNLLYILS